MKLLRRCVAATDNACINFSALYNTSFSVTTGQRHWADDECVCPEAVRGSSWDSPEHAAMTNEITSHKDKRADDKWNCWMCTDIWCHICVFIFEGHEDSSLDDFLGHSQSPICPQVDYSSSDGLFPRCAVIRMWSCALMMHWRLVATGSAGPCRRMGNKPPFHQLTHEYLWRLKGEEQMYPLYTNGSGWLL